MSDVPSKLIMLRVLKEVPVSEYSELRVPNNVTDTKERLGFLKMLRQKPEKKAAARPRTKIVSFNAAVWLNLVQEAKKPVSLWLSYKDSSGEHTVLVDEQCLADCRSVMLSGNSSFRTVGHIEYLRACCGGIGVNERFSVEDVHVRRLEQEVQTVSLVPQTA